MQEMDDVQIMNPQQCQLPPAGGRSQRLDCVIGLRDLDDAGTASLRVPYEP